MSMKTPSDWMNQFTGLHEPILVTVNQMAIRDIQLDAFKAGAEWAATRMKAESMFYSSVGITRRAMNSCHEQIEFVVANLKEIPK